MSLLPVLQEGNINAAQSGGSPGSPVLLDPLNWYAVRAAHTHLPLLIPPLPAPPVDLPRLSSAPPSVLMLNPLCLKIVYMDIPIQPLPMRDLQQFDY
eukprot:scaffold22644_cov44-Cyclotella_meneghiniana.AAC.7